jgi:hypothetical protein
MELTNLIRIPLVKSATAEEPGWRKIKRLIMKPVVPALIEKYYQTGATG